MPLQKLRKGRIVGSPVPIEPRSARVNHSALQGGIRRSSVLLGILTLIVIAAGCSTPIISPEATSQQVRWPPSPDEARYVYETSLRSNRDIEILDTEGLLKRALVGDTRPIVTMRKPYGVAARGGRVYVTDTLLNRVHAFDIPRRRYFQFGFRREGTLQNPLGIAIDNDGRVYVADSEARRVVIYDALGLYLGSVGSPDELDRPTGIAVTPEGKRIYVVDTGGIDSDRHRLVVYSSDGETIFTIGRRGTASGEFNLPTDADVDNAGNLYVLDAGNFRIQVFDTSGLFLREWGGVGTGFGRFARPRALSVDTKGLIYVSDSSFANVQVFDSQGRLLLPVGNKHRQDGPGRLALPAGIANDETGRLYVVDQLFRKVEVLRPAQF